MQGWRSVSFYPRDAMLARVLAMALCLCLSQVGVLSKRLNESGWFLAWDLLSTYATLFCKEIQVLSKMRVLRLWNFARNSGLRKFRHRPLVYRTDRQALSTARFCRAGQLATTDTCPLFSYQGLLWCRLQVSFCHMPA